MSSESGKNSKWDKHWSFISTLYNEGKGETITEITRKVCTLEQIEYNDTHRRNVSKYINSRIKRAKQQSAMGKSNARILLFDIETVPMEVYTFTLYPKNGISEKMIKRNWFISCWSAKWLFEDKIISGCLTEEELKNDDDSRIVKDLWRLFDEANMIIAHNLNQFDEKRSKTRFFLYGLPVPSPYQNIDTLQHARRQFAFSSNRLDYLAERLGLPRKQSTPPGLWKDVADGDYEALKIMDAYCQQDTYVLEEVYLTMRPWIRPHPNMGLYALTTGTQCPSCGGQDHTKLDNDYATYVNLYHAFRCDCCGHTFRSRKSQTPLNGNAQIPVSIPK